VSSEALERAEALLAVEASSVRAPSWWFAAARSAARDVLALLAEVARLEQELELRTLERNMGRTLRAEDSAALAVALEREQRHREALAFYANQPNAHGTYSDVLEDGGDRARAALVDEPAAASEAVSRPNEWTAHNIPEFEYREPPAAATLAEPEGSVEEAHHGATVEARVATPPGSASAAADEPGETPCRDDGRYGVRPHLVVDGVCYTCAGEADARRARLEERGIF
jgi:hypothetical protein